MSDSFVYLLHSDPLLAIAELVLAFVIYLVLGLLPAWDGD